MFLLDEIGNAMSFWLVYLNLTLTRSEAAGLLCIFDKQIS